MKLKLAVLVMLASVASTTFARESFNEHVFRHPNAKATPTDPWFTGPLLAPSGNVVPYGHINYEPYVYWTQNNGIYNRDWRSRPGPTFNNLLLQGSVQYGILPGTEFDTAPQVVYNSTRRQDSWVAGDLPLTLAFQLYHHKSDGPWYPSVKLRLAASAPLGKYDHLSRGRLGTDAGGTGSWSPSVGLVFSRTFHIRDAHYLASRLFMGYNFGTPVRVRGLSIYGGASTRDNIPGTRGTVHPGNAFLFINGYEFSLTQRWVVACDFQYQHTDKTRFHGRSPAGTRPGLPSSDFFSIAPALEYNWSANVGLIAGPWMTFAGRNAPRFTSYVAAFNIYT